jgi:FkbM family methyltransferase
MAAVCRMNSPRWHELLGIARSLLMYYGMPWRSGRMRRFYAQFMQPGDLCFDIGAHVGNRVRIWTALGARTLAVEPQPQLMRVLRRLYEDNPRVTLREVAVGAQAGSATLHISRRTPTVTTLSPAWIRSVEKLPSFSGVTWDTSVEVPVTTLDALIAEHGAPAFCKIDVEGFELEVLRGLTRPLPALSFEYIPAAAELAAGCIARLTVLGYYEYNHAPGESHRLQETRWLSASEMLAVLDSLSEGSGDVYARLVDNDTAGLQL